MTPKHQRFLSVIGFALVLLSGLLGLTRAMWLLRFDGKLDFYPAVAVAGGMLLATASVAKMKKRESAVLLAWLLRIANSIFVLFATLAVFMWLPVNNRGADVLESAIANGLLLIAASLYWWLVHREVSLALKKENA